ncbi:hypothetical protein TWF696_002118 [Orbilia brochopaga]|uniref:Glycosyltransferase family 34 protein n=1 Tax=Orbilia brochopaga TaxID=3140254 RepID=A0AAV9U792_9PEZI
MVTLIMTRDPCLSKVVRIFGIAAVVWLLFTTFQLWQGRPAGQLTDLAKLSTKIVSTNDDKSVQEPPQSKIAKVCMLYYENVTESTIALESAIASHNAHNDRHHYRSYLLRKGILSGFYSKPAYMTTIILEELIKPPEERLEWLVWHDADLVLMNSEIPLEAFLPPPGFEHIHLIATNDLGGLNNGVFFIRINEWSVLLLTALTAYRTYHPGFSSVNEDQVVMDEIIQLDEWKGHVVHVPQRWFNSYHDFGKDADVPPEWHWYHHYFEPGYLLVHFPGAGEGRTDLINQYVKAKAAEPELYDVPFPKTNLTEEIAEYWAKDAKREEKIQKTFHMRQRILESVGSETDRARDKDLEEIRTRMAGESHEKIEEALSAKRKEYNSRKIENLREAEKDQRQAGTGRRYNAKARS